MCGSCLFHPEKLAIICQFRQIIGGAKGYAGPPTKLLGVGGLAPAGPPVPTPVNDSLNMYLSWFILASFMQVNGVGIIAKQISPCCLYRIHNMVSDNSEPTCAQLFIL